jgi:hypothetical protein
MNTVTDQTGSVSPLPWKVKLGLAAFGIVVALLVSVVALQLLSFAPKGTEFASLADLRKAMTDERDSASSPLETDASKTSLRALVRSNADDKIIYTLKPNLDLTFMRARVQTNSCGMRSPERPVLKPKDTYRIALLGDSFAFGWGVEQQQTFAQVLEDTLNRMAPPNKKVEVLNFGVPGYSTFQEVALFEEIGLDFDPDAVLVYFVQNDFGLPFFIRDINGSGGILSSLKFVELGRKLLKPDEMNHKIWEMGLDPNRALTRLATVTGERGIKSFIAINPSKSLKKDQSRLYALKDRKITVIPLKDPLKEYQLRHGISNEELVLSFDPHPSPLRHKILGTILSPYFMEDIL